MTRSIPTLLSLVALLAVGGCSSSSSDAAVAPHGGDHANAGGEAAAADIVDTAVAAGTFQTLVAAVRAAGLVDTLKGEGPYTVFAPTDEAFAALPAGTVESLLLPENREQLVAILTYHVVSGDVRAADVVAMESAPTVQGDRLDIEVTDGGVTVGGARVIQADIACANGVIHVIDSVLLP